MSAEELRRAARVARETADAAPRGPWTIHAPRGYPQRVTNQAAVVVAETFDAPDSPQGAPRHIALWHPLVARAVADWLESEADLWGPSVSDADDHAHRVARALLKEGPTDE